MLDNSIGDTILRIHSELQSRFSHLCRIAIAMYDDQAETLKTFVNSTDGGTPLKFYEVRLADVPSLQKLAEEGKPRVIRDFSVLEKSPSEHSRKLVAAGYQSSYTEPLFCGDKLLGFLFFDADTPDYFDEQTTAYLSSYARMLTAIIAVQFSSLRTLSGALSTAREFSRHRDEETANHLKRMSHYSQLIAKRVAERFNFSEEDVEFIFRFSELHDIGKIAIPDNILLKPGKLNEEEYKVIQSHAAKGREMADMMTREFALEGIQHIGMLRNIIGYHHERYDGSGYPEGLVGESIPPEARVVAVADVLDALTSERPYKRAWSFEEAFEYLKSNSGTQFDPHCVDAVLANEDAFRKIHDLYMDEPFF